jgi:8-hydroxy-5-deazaflavin:NADPH oxidoreductase
MATITIIGTGNMARGIAARALAAGHDIQLLGSTRQKAEMLAKELDSDRITTGESGDALTGDIVFLAVWYPVATQLVQQLGDALAGKVVVDITNPVDVETFDGLVTPADSSAAEEIAKLVPAGAKVVKAFNTTFAGTLVVGQVDGRPLDVLIASDDDDAKATVTEFAESAGLRPLDAGPLRRARQLEALGFLHMTLQPNFGGAYSTAVKVLG